MYSVDGYELLNNLLKLTKVFMSTVLLHWFRLLCFADNKGVDCQYVVLICSFAWKLRSLALVWLIISLRYLTARYAKILPSEDGFH